MSEMMRKCHIFDEKIRVHDPEVGQSDVYVVAEESGWSLRPVHDRGSVRTSGLISSHEFILYIYY